MASPICYFENYFLKFFRPIFENFLKQKFKNQNPKIGFWPINAKSMIKAKQDSISRLALLFAYFLYVCLKINC